MRLRKLILLLLVALATSASLWTASAAATGTLLGAGSRLVAPLVDQWAREFGVYFGTSVTYNDVGSQAGLTDLSQRAVDFGASDAPMTAAQMAACRNCFQIPWALSAVGIGYEVHGIARLHLTGRVLAEIYLGQISNWNNPQIRALNPGVHMPTLRITPIYTNGSGETYAFTDYLSRVSGTWRRRVGDGLTVSFPTGLPGYSDLRVSALLRATNGAIGYVGVSYLIAQKLPAAAIQNSAGHYEYPNLNNIESAARTVRHVPHDDALDIIDPSRHARSAYPISTFSYVIVPADAPQKPLLKKWISYALGGGHVFGPALDFAPMPPVVLRASRAALSSFGSAPG